MKRLLVAYIRISTDRQFIAKNGREAQRADIEAFAAENGYEIAAVFEEAVSGKYNVDCRPQLRAAMELTKKLKATLISSKLDRLSRRASFIMNLMESKLKFVIAELGEDVTPLMMHIHCIISESERKAIGARTKSALQAKKRREGDWKPGNPTNLREAGLVGATAVKKKADVFAARWKQRILDIRARGCSLKEVARTLNDEDVKTARGGQWTAQSVSNLMARW